MAGRKLTTTLIALLSIFVCTKAQNPEIKLSASGEFGDADTLIYIGQSIPQEGEGNLMAVVADLNTIKSINPKLEEDVSVHVGITIPATIKRLIFSPTGNLDSDVADSRNIYDAAAKAVNLAYIAGPRDGTQRIIITLDPSLVAPTAATWRSRELLQANAALGALQALYTPKEIRDLKDPNLRKTKYSNLYIYNGEKSAIEWAKYIEEGRWVARDICGGDPETMNTENILKYTSNLYAEPIKFAQFPILKETHPLVAAVNRGSEHIPRHNGKIVQLSYTHGTPAKAVYFVGKGVTFDTGGLDLRVGGTMVGGKREKCGAAALFGFFKVLEFAKPQNIKFKANLAILRNNFGSHSFSTDEILMSRSGKRIKIGFTDAEGRLIAADLLHEMLEEAKTQKEKDVEFYSIGTFTEHVTKMYKFIMGGLENGVARQKGILNSLQKSSELLSDPLEITALRKEDYDFNRGPLETEDLRNSNPANNVGTQRGTQIAAAFVIQASGLADHGKASVQPFKFVHLDVTGSAGFDDANPTGSPLTLLATHYLLPAAMKPSSKK